MRAAFEAIISVTMAEDDFISAVKSSLESPEHEEYGFHIEEMTERRAVIKFPMSGLSWGERVTITREANSIRIASKSNFPLQFYDLGKNRMNVAAISIILYRAIVRAA